MLYTSYLSNIRRKMGDHMDLKNEQWNLAEDLIKVLEPFSVATSSVLFLQYFLYYMGYLTS